LALSLHFVHWKPHILIVFSLKFDFTLGGTVKAFSLILALFLSINSNAQEPEVNLLDELNPFDPNVEQLLEEYDAWYEAETGQSANIGEDPSPFAARCFRSTCAIWARINKAQQTMHLYVNGVAYSSWPVSTGMPGFTTPNFDRHPNGRIYNSYTSRTYPGGDYMGLGNMPYAVFIQGGFAIHGTPKVNWRLLGRRASHGCIRLHPSHALSFNQMVSARGIGNVWITVE